MQRRLPTTAICLLALLALLALPACGSGGGSSSPSASTPSTTGSLSLLVDNAAMPGTDDVTATVVAVSYERPDGSVSGDMLGRPAGVDIAIADPDGRPGILSVSRPPAGFGPCVALRLLLSPGSGRTRLADGTTANVDFVGGADLRVPLATPTDFDNEAGDPTMVVRPSSPIGLVPDANGFQIDPTFSGEVGGLVPFQDIVFDYVATATDGSLVLRFPQQPALPDFLLTLDLPTVFVIGGQSVPAQIFLDALTPARSVLQVDGLVTGSFQALATRVELLGGTTGNTREGLWLGRVDDIDMDVMEFELDVQAELARGVFGNQDAPTPFDLDVRVLATTDIRTSGAQGSALSFGDLRLGDLVTVQGLLDLTDVDDVDAAEIIRLSSPGLPGGHGNGPSNGPGWRIEGYLTAVDADARRLVLEDDDIDLPNGDEVDSITVEIPANVSLRTSRGIGNPHPSTIDFADLDLGDEIEVRGYLNDSGVFVANWVFVDDDDDDDD